MRYANKIRHHKRLMIDSRASLTILAVETCL